MKIRASSDKAESLELPEQGILTKYWDGSTKTSSSFVTWTTRPKFVSFLSSQYTAALMMSNSTHLDSLTERTFVSKIFFLSVQTWDKQVSNCRKKSWVNNLISSALTMMLCNRRSVPENGHKNLFFNKGQRFANESKVCSIDSSSWI